MIKRKISVVIVILLLMTFCASVFVVRPIFAVSAPKCGDSKPSDTPRIRKIYAKPTHVILYHTAVAQNNTYYFISYGFAAGDERFGVQFNYGATSGRWINYKIKSLTPNTTYFFKIRGGNGCKTGNWSSWVKVKTPLRGSRIYNY